MIRFLAFVFTMGFVILSYSSSTPQEYKVELPKFISKKSSDINSCAKASKGKAGVKGNLILIWEVDEKGSARNISRDGGSAENQELYHCLEKKITSWKFPKPPLDRAIDVTHEFMF